MANLQRELMSVRVCSKGVLSHIGKWVKERSESFNSSLLEYKRSGNGNGNLFIYLYTAHFSELWLN